MTLHLFGEKRRQYTHSETYENCVLGQPRMRYLSGWKTLNKKDFLLSCFSTWNSLPCFIFVWLTEVIASQHKHQILGEAVLDLPHSVSLTSPTLFPSRKFSLFKIIFLETSLVVQWLRLHLVRLWVQSLVREPRSHMPQGQKTRNNIVRNSVKTLTWGTQTWAL